MFWILLLLPINTLAWHFEFQTISPHTYESTPEFITLKQTCDEHKTLELWTLGNSTKSEILSNTINETECTPKQQILSPSPISLKNSGDTLTLQYDSEIQQNLSYPELRKGTRNTEPYSEQWINGESGFYPFVYQGQTATETEPLNPKDSPLQWSELGILEDSDFIEFYTPENINLKGLEIKINGASLYEQTTDLIIPAESYITIWEADSVINDTQNTIVAPKFSGLSSGSAAIEIVAWANTSQEQTILFTCYQSSSLSQAASNEINEAVENGFLTQDCAKINALVTKQSLYWHENQWSILGHKTPGTENIFKNEPPIAQITLQQGSIQKEIPLFYNVTAENSVDPNGDHDLVKYEWLLDQTLISNSSNPSGQYIYLPGHYNLRLIVTDFSGLTDTTNLSLTAESKPLSFYKSSKPSTTTTKTMTTPKKAVPSYSLINNEIELFLAIAPENFWQQIQNKPIPNPTFTVQKRLKSHKGQYKNLSAQNLNEIFKNY